MPFDFSILSNLDLYHYGSKAFPLGAAFAFTLLLQQLIPADPKQKVWNLALAQDLVWFFYERAMQFVIFVTYVAWLSAVFEANFATLSWNGLEVAPAWARLIVGLLLVDLLYWVQHWLNHNVSWLWQFHALHHSQKELNFFTDFRYHGVEYLVRHTVLTIPLLMLKFDIPTVVAVSVFRSIYSRFYHGNIKTNLGVLKYILVTPQSHRVHHANADCYRNKNYGALFSIWDHLFGTQVKQYEIYPATGIDDDNFPYERSANPLRLALEPLIQMLYPFKVLINKVRGG